MRKLIMWNMMTLDGYFEGARPWEIDWHETVWGPELEKVSLEQGAAADTILFGRKTYEGMADYWRTAEGDEESREVAEMMNSIEKVVFSRTLKTVDWNNARLANGKPEDVVARLKERDGKDILIFGSANLASTLTEHGLIDEYRIGLTPILIGAGTPLFKPAADRLRMRLLEARPLETGCVILRFEPMTGE